MAWNRSDQAFFAAGACHILAWTFCEQYPDAGFSVVAIRKLGQQHACHVYVSDGTWAFDHAGWTLEDELLTITEAYEGCRMERLLIRTDLVTFCQQHHSRPPKIYLSDPWPRARTYLTQFASYSARHHRPRR